MVSSSSVSNTASTGPAPEHRSPETTTVWGGEERYLLDRATQVPVVHSVAYGDEDFDEWYVATGHIYGRNTNPTVAVFEEKVRILEEGEAATSASTGMAAISNLLYALVKPGQRVVSVKDQCAYRHRFRRRTYAGAGLLGSGGRRPVRVR